MADKRTHTNGNEITTTTTFGIRVVIEKVGFLFEFISGVLRHFERL